MTEPAGTEASDESTRNKKETRSFAGHIRPLR